MLRRKKKKCKLISKKITPVKTKTTIKKIIITKIVLKLTMIIIIKIIIRRKDIIAVIQDKKFWKKRSLGRKKIFKKKTKKMIIWITHLIIKTSRWTVVIWLWETKKINRANCLFNNLVIFLLIKRRKRNRNLIKIRRKKINRGWLMTVNNNNKKMKIIILFALCQ